MRAEIVLELARRLKEEESGGNVLELLKDISTALDHVISQPSETSAEAIAVAKSRLDEVLKDAASNFYSPAWRRLLVQAKLRQFVGTGLLNAVNRAMSSAGSTPAETKKKLAQIIKWQETFVREISNTIDGLEYFEIKDDILEPGDFEIVIAIPGLAIDNELKKLGKEAQDLNNILLPFEELATGSREPIKLRALGSSDPTLFLHSHWATAALIATGLERLAKGYAQLQAIIKNHRELKASKAPENILDQIKKFFEDELTTKIEEISTAILAQKYAAIDAARENELHTELKRSLTELARRLDEGYQFDVRGKAPEPPAEGEPPPELEAQMRAAKVVSDSRPQLLAFEAAEEPILKLPRQSDVS